MFISGLLSRLIPYQAIVNEAPMNMDMQVSLYYESFLHTVRAGLTVSYNILFLDIFRGVSRLISNVVALVFIHMGV